MSESIIRVEHLNKQFIVDKKPIQVLKDINLEVQKGEFITIVGHSGCGKSTLLKIICGLVGYEDGVVERNGHKVEGPGPMCGMEFQDHRLLPWLKIKDNVGFGLKDLSKKEKLGTRVKNIINIMVPLIFSVLNRVDVISNAMDLRGFGKHKKRTWYTKKPLHKGDYVSLVICLLALAGTLLMAATVNHGRFWNPFVYGWL